MSQATTNIIFTTKDIAIIKSGSHDCSICMTPIVFGDPTIMKTKCNHLFHKQCIKQWIDT